MNEKMFLNECCLQKVNQFDALEAIGKDKEVLSLGKELVLEIDEDNEGKDSVFAKLGESKIGVLSEEDSKIIRKFLKAGWKDVLFESRISKYDEKADENKRYSIAIRIKKAPENKETSSSDEAETE
jgi:hypothetical protein